MPLYLGSNKISRVDIIKHLTTDNIQLEQKTVEPLETTHTYYPSGDYDAFSQFTVNGATLQIKTVSPSENLQKIIADSDNYGLKQVNINPMNLSDKEITENGTYIASSDNLDGYKQVVVNVPNEGILPLIANDGSIVPTGTYATEKYYNLEYGVKIGYMANGDVMISMKNGTSTAYENLYFHAASLPSGVTLDAPSTFDSGNVVGMTFVGIISGLTGSANIAINMSTRNSTQDYVRCDLTITYV